MTNLPMFPEHDSGSDDTPLPLLVAKKWDFPLAYHIVDGTYFYAIQDWMRGLSGEEDIRYILSKLKKQFSSDGMWNSIPRLPYKASDGRTYPRDFAMAENLYLIAQYMRVTRARPVLHEIREFLSKAGVFVDEMRRDENLIVISSGMSADQMLDATARAAEVTRKAYRKQGKSERWIDMRLQGKMRRDQFVTALGMAIAESLKRHHYATATDDIYRGLWNRTAAHLKKELMLPKKASLRDHQPMLALYYQGIAEEASSEKLGERQEILWVEAREIVKTVAAIVGRQAQEMSVYLKKDLATGRPLLAGG
jgi:hypothetical protein